MIPTNIALPSGALPFLGLLVTVLAWLIAKWPIHRKSSPQIQQPEKEPFTKPLPSPSPHDPTSNYPKLYRPFRHGPNFITMGIRKLHWDNWIEMDSYFLRYHDMKAAELEKNFKEHVKYVDNAVTKDACFELNEELVLHLTHRYPKIFRLEGGKVHNSLTGEAFPFPAATPDEALATSALLVQDDLVLMIKNDDGEYHLDAAAVCLPGFWRLREKFRMSLDTLHFEAGVPHYAAKLQKAMNRFMLKLTPDKPVERNNFFIQLDDGLHWSHRMGDQQGTEVASWATANGKGLTIDEIHFRSERQTLRRLPRSGAILFTIRTYFEPVTKLAQEPHIPGRLAEAIRNWDETVSYYKGKSSWDKILMPYLEEQDRLQKEQGLVEETEGEFPY
ncbi:Protein of unknown function DUF3445 [Penicillium coprophilum]|uniref:Protein of unknown function DUF3445 n=1 Tax=Penicillium coprophilum TaxID=36646 RepID=UPI00239F3C98|nr:Protein of unknown function DUF3445 [Penicillium coprophilum]KAJ5153830.1 Protein of unknown function DUF3445 [Penicillium coprophilum]